VDRLKLQIPDFVTKGDIMLLDWFCHFKRSTGEKAIADPNTPPASKAAAQSYLDNVRTQPLGHYRDPLGHVGAAQLIVVEHVTDFLAKMNAAANEAAIAEVQKADAPFNLSALQAGHRWVSLEGNSLTVRVPMPAAQWAQYKAEFLRNLLSPSACPDDEDYMAVMSVLSSISGYEEQAEEIVLRIGSPDQEALTLRAAVRSLSEYNPELEDTIARAIPADFDAELAKALLDGQPEAPFDVVVQLAPVEAKATALLEVIRNGDPAHRAKALSALDTLAVAYDAAGHLPTAPAAATTPEGQAQWQQWYLKVARYPLDESWPAATQPATTQAGTSPAGRAD